MKLTFWYWRCRYCFTNIFKRWLILYECLILFFYIKVTGASHPMAPRFWGFHLAPVHALWWRRRSSPLSSTHSTEIVAADSGDTPRSLWLSPAGTVTNMQICNVLFAIDLELKDSFQWSRGLNRALSITRGETFNNILNDGEALSQPSQSVSVKSVPKVVHRYGSESEVSPRYTFQNPSLSFFLPVPCRCVLRSTVESTFTYYSATRGSFLIQNLCKKAKEGKEIEVIRREITAEALVDDPVEFPRQKKIGGVK